MIAYSNKQAPVAELAFWSARTLTYWRKPEGGDWEFVALSAPAGWRGIWARLRIWWTLRRMGRLMKAASTVSEVKS